MRGDIYLGITRRIRGSVFKRVVAFLLLASFLFSHVIPPSGFAQTIPVSKTGSLNLPDPGAMIAPSAAYAPCLLKGMTVNLDNPFAFDFILDTGETHLTGKALQDEANQLIKYFLTSLTIPEDDLWVNLSPYEKDRIIPNEFGQTEMGRDLLAQDYLLKQLTASLMHPDKALGDKFWKRVYEKAQQQFGTTEIPVDTFNKVWIVPDRAVVYQSNESSKTAVAFVLESNLKVMLEEDYVALSYQKDSAKSSTPVGDVAMSESQKVRKSEGQKDRKSEGQKDRKSEGQNYDEQKTQRSTQNDKSESSFVNRETVSQRFYASQATNDVKDINKLGNEIIRSIILPELEREVNHGEHFVRLRQIYASLILAKWYKENLKASVLNQKYSDQKKTVGIDIEDKTEKEKIYQQYLQAFKKGVFNYIKEDYDEVKQEIVPRKYFSGGMVLKVPLEVTDQAMLGGKNIDDSMRNLQSVRGGFTRPGDQAMVAQEDPSSDAFQKGWSLESTAEVVAKWQAISISQLEHAKIVFEEIHLFFKSLESSDVGTRIRGINSLGLLIKNGLVDEEIIIEMKILEKLRLAINDESGAVRVEVMGLLEKVMLQGSGALSSEIIPVLVRALEIGDPSVREAAAQALGNGVMHWDELSRAIIPALVRALEDGYPSVRAAAVQALGSGVMHWGELSRVIIPALVRILPDKEDVHARVVQILENGVSQGGELSGAIILALVSALKDGYPSVRAAAAQALVHGVLQGGELSGAIILALVSALEDVDTRVRAAVAQALGQSVSHWGDLSGVIITALVNALGDKSYSVRAAAAQALGQGVSQWGDLSRAIISALVNALKDEYYSVRAAAAQALGQGVSQWGDLSRTIISALVNAIGNGAVDGRVIAAAVQALGQGVSHWGDLSRDIILALVWALGQGEYHVHAAAARALEHGMSQGGELSRAIIPALVRALEGVDPSVRTAAEQILGHGVSQRGRLWSDVITALLDALRNETDNVRREAVQILGINIAHWGRLSNEIVTELLRIVNDSESQSVRLAVDRVLGKVVSQGDELSNKIIAELMEVLNDVNHPGFANAVYIMGYGVEFWGDRSNAIVTALLTAIKDSASEHVRFTAQQELSKVVSQGGELSNKIIADLMNILNDAKHPGFENAVDVIGSGSDYWGELSSEIIPKLIGALNEGPEYVRRVAVQILGNSITHWGDLSRNIVAALLNVLNDPKHPGFADAVYVLGHGDEHWGDLSNDIITALVEALGNSVVDDVRAKTEQALGKVVAQGGELSKTIIKMLFDKLKNSPRNNDRRVAARMLGNSVAHWGELSNQIVDKLMEILGNRGSVYESSEAEQALGKVVSQGSTLSRNIIMWLIFLLRIGVDSNASNAAARILGNNLEHWGNLSNDIISALLKALENRESDYQSETESTLSKAVSQGGALSRKVLIELLRALRNGPDNVRTVAARIFSDNFEHWDDLSSEIISVLLMVLKNEKNKFTEIVAGTLGLTVKQGRLKVLTMTEITEYFLLSQEMKRKKMILANDAANVRQVLILKIHFIVKEKIDPDDVTHVGQIADATKGADSLKVILDTIRGWAVNGSVEAQNYLEGKIGQITERKLNMGQDYVQTDERDEVYIEAMTGSSQERSLLPIFTDRKFHPKLRIMVMKILAKSGVIDPEFEKVEDGAIGRYLSIVSTVYEKTGRIISNKLADSVDRNELTTEAIINGWPWIMVEDGLMPYRSGERKLNLEKVEFGDGGNAVANFHEFMREVLSKLPDTIIERPVGLPIKEPLIRADITVYETSSSLSQEVGLIEGTRLNLKNFRKTFGRTLEFRENGKAVHFKFLKKGEDAELLAYEYDMMKFLRSRKQAWGLKGMHPEGRVRIGRIKSSALSEVLTGDLQGKEGAIELDETDGYYTFMAYEIDVNENGNNDYYTYLNDPDLSEEEFRNGLEINVYDRMIMAQHGLFDMEIIELFHNQQHGQGRRYDWMVDIRHHQQHRRGAGRLNDIIGATMFPNLRLSGTADYAGILFIGDIIRDPRLRSLADDRISRLLNMVGKDYRKVEKYVRAALLGDTLLSLALIIPTYYERKDALKYATEKSNSGTPFQNNLKLLFEVAFKAISGLRQLPPEIENLNVSLIAQQMAYYLTDQYREDLLTSSFPAEEIYPGSKVELPRLNERYRGWSNARGWDVSGKTYRIPTRNPSLQMDRLSRDLGYVNGFLPPQELIKALYVLTTMLTVSLGQGDKNKSFDEAMISSKADSKQSPGGIDLNPELFDLERQGEDLLFDIPAHQDWEQIHIKDGLVPVIKTITPITNQLIHVLQREPIKNDQLTGVR